MTLVQMQRLAKEYQDASLALRKLGRPGAPLSFAPFRLTAIHAVELYLSAYLLGHGHQWPAVRRLQHDLAERARLAVEGGLNLREKTKKHLHDLDAGREYVHSRYAPELVPTMTQVNRLEATLKEVATKVRKASTVSPAGAALA